MDSLRCSVVSSGRQYQGQQGFAYLEGLNGATTGSRGICMTILTIPPGVRAKNARGQRNRDGRLRHRGRDRDVLR
jgi:uncharacterized RmlC-like cupin family protein